MIWFVFRRTRWILLGAGVKWVARRGVGRSVDEAAADIEERLPESVVHAVNALPGDVLRYGGAAVVSARAAQRGAVVAQRSAVVAQRGAVVAQRGVTTGGSLAAKAVRAGRVAASTAADARPQPDIVDRLRSAREAVADQAELERRDLRSDFQRYLHGGGPAGERAAIEALLDRRRTGSDSRPPIPSIPDPVPAGRRRFVRSLPAPEVARVQRSYRRPQKPWDRRLRPGRGSTAAGE